MNKIPPPPINNHIVQGKWFATFANDNYDIVLKYVPDFGWVGKYRKIGNEKYEMMSSVEVIGSNLTWVHHDNKGTANAVVSQSFGTGTWEWPGLPKETFIMHR